METMSYKDKRLIIKAKQCQDWWAIREMMDDAETSEGREELRSLANYYYHKKLLFGALCR